MPEPKSTPSESIPRRSFLKSSAGVAALAGAITRPASARIVGANDRVNMAVIGCGGRGTHLLRDLVERSKEQGGVQVVAVCDVYEKRKQRAQAISGAEVHHLHGEICDRPDVDACVVATPDHWHAPIGIDVMQAGKDLYLEKPMTRTVEEAKEVYRVAQETQAVVQIGNGGASSDTMWRARGAIQSGMIGKLVWSQSTAARNSQYGEWNWGIDPDGSEKTIDWKAWLGNAPSIPFDADRYFRFRKYWDYSGGTATDLYYHSLGALCIALGAEFPYRVVGTGGNWVTRDQRDVPDTFFTNIDYPSQHSVILAGSMAQSVGLPVTIRGHEATITFDRGGEKRDGGITIKPEGLYSDRFKAKYGNDELFIPEKPREDHMANFLSCVRTRARTHMPADRGYKVMAAIGMTIESYRQGKMLFWDAEKEKVIDKDPGLPV